MPDPGYFYRIKETQLPPYDEFKCDYLLGVRTSQDPRCVFSGGCGNCPRWHVYWRADTALRKFEEQVRVEPQGYLHPSLARVRGKQVTP